MPSDAVHGKRFPGKKPFIKICGLTDPETALECARLGADAIGLVFYEKSPRNISVKTAARISNTLPDHILTIGVFVNNTFDEIMEKVRSCSLKGVQLHGNESSDLIDRLKEDNLVVIKALFAKKHPFLTEAESYKNADFLLVEYGKGVLPGGNAESWDYRLSLQLKTHIPVVLAGGLTPANVRQAITSANPAGIDVSSGVEKSPGVKDLIKVKSFITRARSL